MKQKLPPSQSKNETFNNLDLPLTLC